MVALSRGRVDARSGCYLKRVRNFDNTIAAIIDNEFVGTAGQQLVTISASDAGFRNDSDCEHGRVHADLVPLLHGRAAIYRPSWWGG